MAVKTQWMEQFFMSVRTYVQLAQFSSGSASSPNDEDSATFTNSAVITTGDDGQLGGGDKHFTDVDGVWGVEGPSGSKVFTIPVKNFPNFDAGQEINTDRKAIGSPVKTAGTGYEILRGTSSPNVTYEIDVDAKTMIPFLWCLFQKGTVETFFDQNETPSAVNAAEMSFTPPKLTSTITDPASTEAYATLYKKMSLSAADGHVVSDATCSSMTLTGAEGEPFTCSADFNGRFFTTNFDHDAGSGGLATTLVNAYPENQPLMWHDAHVTIEDTAGSGVHYVVPCQSFNLTITPQILAKRYNSRWPIRYVVNDWEISGQLVMPWGGFGTSAGVVDQNYLLTKWIDDTNPTTINVTPFELYVTWVTDADWDYAIGDAITNAKVAILKDFQATDGTTGNFGKSASVNHTSGDFGIFMGMYPTNVSISGDDETMVTMDFDCVDIRSGNTVTQNSLDIKSLSAKHYGGTGSGNAAGMRQSGTSTTLTDVGQQT